MELVSAGCFYTSLHRFTLSITLEVGRIDPMLHVCKSRLKRFESNPLVNVKVDLYTRAGE